MLPDQQANAGKMEGKKQKKSSPPNLIQAKSNLDKLQNETEQIISQAVYSDEDGSVVEESIVKLQKFNSEPVKAKSSSTLLNSKSKAAAPKPQQQKKNAPPPRNFSKKSKGDKDQKDETLDNSDIDISEIEEILQAQRDQRKNKPALTENDSYISMKKFDIEKLEAHSDKLLKNDFSEVGTV